MIKNRSHLIISSLLLYSGCQNKKTPSMSDLQSIGYQVTYCDNISYHDAKADLSEDPFYKIYKSLRIEDPNLSILAARCFNEKTCMYELVENNEVVCQKYIVSSDKDLVKTRDDHKVLVFNTKNNM